MSFIHKDLLNPDLDLSAYRAKVSLVTAVENAANAKKFGYSYKLKSKERENRLPYLIALQRREKIRRALGGGCLDTTHIQLIHDRMLNMSDNCDTSDRKDIHADHSNKDSWLEANPGCVGREPWERLKYLPCGPIMLGIDVNQKVCEITAPVFVEKKQCEVEVEVDVCKDVCDIVLNLESCSKECDVALDVLKTQCKTCDISLDSLQRCDTECGLGNTILEVAKCNTEK